MSETVVQPLSAAEPEEVLAFELENHAFFESVLPGRGDDYYSLENIERTIQGSIRERDEGSSYMYLVRDGPGEVVGRVNLYNARWGHVQAAELGFRIGRNHGGRGHATRAVGLVLNDAFEKYGLHRVEAGTFPDNVGSQIVLIKNGFQFVGRSRRSTLFMGHWHDSLLFERHADANDGP